MMKPMLAAKADLEKVKFPIVLQPKYDGIRCLMETTGALSRTLKPIPNLYVQKRLSGGDLLGLDGELVSYTNGKMDSLYEVQSKVMSVDGEFDFVYHVFDDFVGKSLPYMKRLEGLRKRLLDDKSEPLFRRVKLTDYHIVGEMRRLLAYEEELVSEGWEGMIGRDPNGRYKYGRATTNEGLLLKFKQFEDDEAVVIGFEELEHNENEAFLDERGQTKRSSHKENKVAGDVLGALILNWNGIEFKVGTGFDADQRADIWTRRDSLLGQTVTFKYKGTGPNGKPLISSFKAFRTDVVKTLQPKAPEQESFF